MAFSLSQLFIVGIAYLGILFLTAYATENGWLPAKLVRHPATYVLSLGVFASAWAIYGVVGFAHDYGYNFLAYYLGISGAFMLAPIVLAPVLRLVQSYQLGSLADMFAFRFRSQLLGSFVAIFLVGGILPLLSMQIKAVADSIHILNQESTTNTFALFFCVIMILFAILFGARHFSAREKHDGLVVAIAFESLVKLAAMLILGFYCLYGVFGSWERLDLWLRENRIALRIMYDPLSEGPWRSLILSFFASAVVMPQMFHMSFVENLNPRALLTASWGLPLFLLLMSISVPVILWAALYLQPDTVPEYFSLGIGLATSSLPIATVVFIGGLSAASGVIIVCTIALSGMVLNHLILPIYQPSSDRNLYKWLLWLRRLLIAAIIMFAYLLYLWLGDDHKQTDLGMISFVATLQLVPGVIGVVLWRGANRNGVVAGLAAGSTVWFWGMLVPEFLPFDVSFLVNWLGFGESVLPAHAFAIVATIVNVATFIVVSVFTTPSEEELAAADACTVDNLRRPYRWQLDVFNVRDVIARLAQPLGHATAAREVELALNDLGMSYEEARPYALRRLRDQLEANLSGLLGPSVSQEIIDQCLPYKNEPSESSNEDIYFIENRLEEYQDKLTGLAAELDNLRRFHRQTLHDLPMGLCSLGGDQEILGWNRMMELLTAISAGQVVGSRLMDLPEPWGPLLDHFINQEQSHQYQKSVELEGQARWMSLHKAAIGAAAGTHGQGGLVIVVEDITDVKSLEAKLTHSERLASIGRLAAGVAHEIGNPITGIACLAQNMRYEMDDPEMREMTNQIIDQTKRVTRIVQSLVTFSHAGNHAKQINEIVSVSQCVDEAIHLLTLSKREHPIPMINETCPHWVHGDSQRLVQVFVNLLSNARDATSNAKPVCVSSRQQGSQIAVEVTDAGSGIPKEMLERIFEPFVTTKDPGKGTGLGLALVYSIIEDHQGRIEVTSPLEGKDYGTRFTILLPRAEPPQDSKGEA